jgi:hypothetical protein
MSICNIVKDIGIYLFDNAVIPVMLFLDDNFGIFTDLKDKMDSKDKVKPNTKLNEMTYDCEHDLIKIKYYFDNKEYVLCINRMNPIIVKEIINKELKRELKRDMAIDYIINADLNGTISITDRINKYIGTNGFHLKYDCIKIKYFLTSEEIDNFEKLTITDTNCNDHTYVSVEDNLDILDII